MHVIVYETSDVRTLHIFSFIFQFHPCILVSRIIEMLCKGQSGHFPFSRVQHSTSISITFYSPFRRPTDLMITLKNNNLHSRSSYQKMVYFRVV